MSNNKEIEKKLKSLWDALMDKDEVERAMSYANKDWVLTYHERKQQNIINEGNGTDETVEDLNDIRKLIFIRKTSRETAISMERFRDHALNSDEWLYLIEYLSNKYSNPDEKVPKKIWTEEEIMEVLAKELKISVENLKNGKLNEKQWAVLTDVAVNTIDICGFNETVSCWNKIKEMKK